MELLKIPAQKS